MPLKVDGSYLVESWPMLPLIRLERKKAQILETLRCLDPNLRTPRDEQWYYSVMDIINLPQGWTFDCAGTDDVLCLHFDANLGPEEVLRYFPGKTRISTMQA